MMPSAPTPPDTSASSSLQPGGKGPPWAEQLVRFLDDGLVVPGTRYRVGFDGLLGLLVPGAGDAMTAAGALSLFWLALQRGVPRVVLARMAINIALDATVGAIPILGDLFDFVFKANRRNLHLIERATREPSRRRTAGDYVVVALFGLLILSAVSLPFLLTGLLLAQLLK
jgi:hypothetical protein